jgi:hypothetical protein
VMFSLWFLARVILWALFDIDEERESGPRSRRPSALLAPPRLGATLKPWHEVAASAEAETPRSARLAVALSGQPANDASPVPLVRGPRIKSAQAAYAVSWVTKTPQVVQCKTCGCARLRTRIPLGWVGCGTDWTCADCRREEHKL